MLEKVKIKRIKRNQKKTSAKEKVLAGLGLGGALMGGMGGGALQRTEQKPIVRTVEKDASSIGGKIKQKLKHIFGVKEAKAADDIMEGWAGQSLPQNPMSNAKFRWLEQHGYQPWSGSPIPAEVEQQMWDDFNTNPDWIPYLSDLGDYGSLPPGSNIPPLYGASWTPPVAGLGQGDVSGVGTTTLSVAGYSADGAIPLYSTTSGGQNFLRDFEGNIYDPNGIPTGQTLQNLGSVPNTSPFSAPSITNFTPPQAPPYTVPDYSAWAQTTPNGKPIIWDYASGTGTDPNGNIVGRNGQLVISSDIISGQSSDETPLIDYSAWVSMTGSGHPIRWDYLSGIGYDDVTGDMVAKDGNFLPVVATASVDITETAPRISLATIYSPVEGTNLYKDNLGYYYYQDAGGKYIQTDAPWTRAGEQTTVIPPYAGQQGNQSIPLPNPYANLFGGQVLATTPLPVSGNLNNNSQSGEQIMSSGFTNPYANVFGGQVLATVPSAISGAPIYREIPLPSGNRAWTTDGINYTDGGNFYKYDPAVSSDLLWYNADIGQFVPFNIARGLSIAALDQPGGQAAPSGETESGKQDGLISSTTKNLRTVTNQAGETGRRAASAMRGIFQGDNSNKPDDLNLDPSRLKSLAKIGVATGVSMVATPAGGMAAGYLMRSQSQWDRLVDWATNPDKFNRDGYVTFTNPDTGQKEKWSKNDVQNMLAFLQAQGLKP